MNFNSGLLALILTMAMLVGACAGTPTLDPNFAMTVAEWQDQRDATRIVAMDMGDSCVSDLCRYMVVKELADGSGAFPVYKATRHPVAQVMDSVGVMAGKMLPIGMLAVGARQSRLLTENVVEAVASMPGADHSINVGGNYGDTDQSVDTATTTPTTTTYGDFAGNGNVSGDGNGDGPRDSNVAGGDLIVGDRNQNTGRQDSPDDNTDNSDNSDNSNPEPPVAEPPVEGGG